jgi:hypothetical protein
MHVGKFFFTAALGVASVMAATPVLAVNFETTFDINSGNTPNFQVTYANNADIRQATLITADFRNGYNRSNPAFTDGTFSDTYQFRVGADGVGSGNLSTSFSTSLAEILISSIVINGATYFATPNGTGTGQTFSVSDIPITSFFNPSSPGTVNTIVVNGQVRGETGSYQGGLTFNASAVPEPATWAMMLVGFGAIGAISRSQRRSIAVRFG